MASFMDWQPKPDLLLQNCDLPPPLKLFSPFEKKDNGYYPKITKLDDDELEPNNSVENTSLRRALQLSQSRAREAEEKAVVAGNDKEQLAALFLNESLRLSAHRQWVRLLEIETILLKKKPKMMMMMMSLDRDGDDSIDEALNWCFTLALCLGIGFALGRYII